MEGVEDLHHLHVWELDERHRALEAHIVIAESRAGDPETIKDQIKQHFVNDYDISHSMLEFEFPGTDSPGCDEASMIVPR